jgi:hypothetical protein
MKLSKTTLGLLKNLATINTNLLIRPGSKLSTISTNKNVAAEVEIEETFDTQFGIYDLSEFLGMLTLFEDPELDFSERALTISEGRSSIRYLPADQDVIVYPKNTTQKFPADAEVEFELTAAVLQNVIRSASVLKMPFVTVQGDGEKMELIVRDKENANSNRFTVQLGETDKTFCFNIKVENFKMVIENYNVQISSKKVARFQGTNKTYMLACEYDSTYEG